VLLSFDPALTPRPSFPKSPTIATIGEREPDIAAVAAPVFGPGPSLRGAIAVSGPSVRFSSEAIREISAHLVSAAIELTRRLGGDASLIPPASIEKP
jgi:hypothetical protein